MSATIRGTEVEIPLPPRWLRLMGDSDERFVDQAVELAERAYEYGLEDDHEILDVGCSTGRLAVGLLAGTDFSGRYVGFDVMRKHVRWARKSIPPVAPDFHFRYVDVHNDRYNPEGTIQPADLNFPARSGGFHMATLFSIFTHFYREDTQLYLHELRRVLRPGGIVVASWFLWDDDSLDRAVDSPVHPMAHRLDDVTIYRTTEDPLHAIAFHESTVREMIDAAGLEIVEIQHGKWKGDPGPAFQDVVVLRRPGQPDESAPVPTSRSLLTRVRGRLARIARRDP